MKTPHIPAFRRVIVAAAAVALVVGMWGSAGKKHDPGASAFESLPLGQHLDVMAIPEPGVLVSLIGGAAVLLGFQRFRRHA